MLILYILILFLLLYGIKFKLTGMLDDYLAKEQCNAIKGVFILLVFIRHIYQYIKSSEYDMSPFLDRAGLYIDSLLGQLIVVMFLFYSGYGVMYSIKRKGETYIKTMPKKRILTTLLNFDVAVVAFVLLDFILNTEVTIPQILLSLVGWDSVGNSNWYIFGIILCYSFVYVGCTCFKPHQYVNVVLSSVFIVMLVASLSFVKESWWYNTLLCFPLGLWYSVCQDKIESIAQKHYWALFVMVLLAFALSYHFFTKPMFNVVAILFALIVVMLTMKVHVGNPILNWLGKNLFPLYIYQRLPMIALFAIGDGKFVSNHPIVYIILCFAMTVLLAFLYKHWEIRLQNRE